MTPNFNTALQIIGFGLNIAAVQRVYFGELLKESTSTESAEDLFTAQREQWRFWCQVGGLLMGCAGYFIRDNYGLTGAILMYLGVFLIACQLTRKWLPKPLESTKELLQIGKKSS